MTYADHITEPMGPRNTSFPVKIAACKDAASLEELWAGAIFAGRVFTEEDRRAIALRRVELGKCPQP